MGVVEKLIRKYRHFGWLSLFGIILILYHYCENYLEPKYVIESFLDNYIPFIKEFIIAYLFWFLYMAIGVIYLGLRSVKDYYKLIIFMFSGMLICYIIYIIFPNGLDLRPDISGNDMFSSLVKFIHKVDTPTNVCPSIHVFNSIAVHVALVRSSLLEGKKGYKAASLIAMLLICASTVFVKQHSIVDLIWGVVLGFICYMAVYRLPEWMKGSYKVEKDVSALEE
ncbi:MAG: phosphatase PAP2 family protein [Mahellales bacterium]|jgi:membrane-associated phospholipid phosphatase